METPPPNKPYRILSLNGGGARSILQAHYLNHIVQDPDIGSFWRDFDLIVGTSAGAIVAAALWKGMPLPTLVHLIEQDVPKVFPKRWWQAWFSMDKQLAEELLRLAERTTPLFLSQVTQLKEILFEHFGSVQLGEKETKPLVAITATELESGHIRVFSLHPDAGPRDEEVDDRGITIVDALMASTALPIAFPEYVIDEKRKGQLERRHYLDGGLWGNVPLLVGVSLAAQEGVPLSDLRIVSIGTAGSTKNRFTFPYSEMSLCSAEMYKALFNMTQSATEDMAYEALARLVSAEHFVHLDKDLPENKIEAFDAEEAINILPEYAQELARDPHKTEKLKAIIKS